VRTIGKASVHLDVKITGCIVDCCGDVYENCYCFRNVGTLYSLSLSDLLQLFTKCRPTTVVYASAEMTSLALADPRELDCLVKIASRVDAMVKAVCDLIKIRNHLGLNDDPKLAAKLAMLQKLVRLYQLGGRFEPAATDKAVATDKFDSDWVTVPVPVPDVAPEAEQPVGPVPVEPVPVYLSGGLLPALFKEFVAANAMPVAELPGYARKVLESVGKLQEKLMSAAREGDLELAEQCMVLLRKYQTMSMGASPFTAYIADIDRICQ
jgi:hypothetical protein